MMTPEKALLSTLILIALLASPALAQDREQPAVPGTANVAANTVKFTQTEGEALYVTACSGCHGMGGGGAYGAAIYPPLAANARLETARYPVNLILEGNGAMPAFHNWLDDEQVAAVTNYIRENLGNRYESDLTAGDIVEMRDDFADLDGG